MANLKGSSYAKQVRNAFHRLEAFGVSRHGSRDHSTHSNALAEKREMYLNDYKVFAEKNNFTDKLNQTMTDKNMDKFLSERVAHLALKSKVDYLRGWSSMIQGLKENNISIAIDKSYFDNKVSEAKNTEPKNEVQMNRAIANVSHVINKLYSNRYESGVIAEVQYNLGLRVSEAIELVKNPENYIHGNSAIGIVGKGNHVYEPKSISHELVAKISLAQNIPHENTYRNDLSTATENSHTPHDFRYSYAQKIFHEKIEAHTPYAQILKEVSQELNHSRSEMTNYYLNRA